MKAGRLGPRQAARFPQAARARARSARAFVVLTDRSAPADGRRSVGKHEAVLIEEAGERGSVAGSPGDLVVGQHARQLRRQPDARLLRDLLRKLRPRSLLWLRRESRRPEHRSDQKQRHAHIPLPSHPRNSLPPGHSFDAGFGAGVGVGGGGKSETPSRRNVRASRLGVGSGVGELKVGVTTTKWKPGPHWTPTPKRTLPAFPLVVV